MQPRDRPEPICLNRNDERRDGGNSGDVSAEMWWQLRLGATPRPTAASMPHHAPPPAIAPMTTPVPAPTKPPPIAHRADQVVAEVNNGSKIGA